MSVRSLSSTASSGLQPVNKFALQEQMAAHYRRLQKVKPVVDTSPPKSYVLKHASRSHSTSPVRTPSRVSSSNSHRTLPGSWDETAHMNNMRLTVNRINYYLAQLNHEQNRLLSQVSSSSQLASHWHQQQRSNSRNSARPSQSGSAKSSSATSRRSLNKKDLIEKDCGHFTPQNPFTPRVLISDAKSKLLEYRFYNPPRRKPQQPNKMEKLNGDSNMLPMSGTYKINSKSGGPPLLNEDQLYEMLMTSEDETDEGEEEEEEYVKPHANLKSWFQRNAKLKRDQVSNNNSKGNGLTPLKAFHPFGSTHQKEKNNKIFTHQPVHKSNDDDLKYLEFVVEVTNDVLARGIFTDKALNQIFHQHAEKRKKELDMDKMLKALDDLRINLGISSSTTKGDTFSDNSFSSSAILKRNSATGNHEERESKINSTTTTNSPSSFSPRRKSSYVINSELISDRLNETFNISNGVGKNDHQIEESYSSFVETTEEPQNVESIDYKDDFDKEESLTESNTVDGFLNVKNEDPFDDF